MTQYSISTLELLSGIKSHTIRIWEKRYNVLKPKRTNTNIRYYDDDQLAKLLNIVSLVHNGARISEVSKMSEEELKDEVDSILDGNGADEAKILAFTYQLISTSLTYDTLGFETVYKKLIERFNTEDAFHNVLLPLMKIILFNWNKSKINPEKKHFLTNLIRQKLMTAIDILPLPDNSEERWLLFLPPHEYQDIALLYAHYLLKKNNKTVLYLGNNVPVEDVEIITKSFQPTHSMFLFFREMSERTGEKYMRDIQSVLSDSEIIVSGNTSLIERLKAETRIVNLETASDFKEQYL